MKILQVNKYHYPRGGADKYFLDLTDNLRQAEHKVAVFAMTHPKNLPSPWSAYFVSNISFNQSTFSDKLKTVGRVLYSLEAKRKFKRLLNDFQPEVIHLHNIYHQLSPSILDVVRSKNIPVVMHLHDYKLVCPNHALFIKNNYCDKCRPNKYYHCLSGRCVKNSLAGSLLAATEMYLHHSLLKIYKKNIKLFIAPSQFMKKTIISFGWSPENIRVIYNPYSSDLNTPMAQNSKNDNYLLYFGRLSPEKGISTLIKALAGQPYQTLIVGEGPERDALEKLAQTVAAPVSFLGFKEATELAPLISGARAVIIPSIWAENMPLNLLEALSLGKTVIASNIGGLAEIIRDGENGWLFTAGDEQALLFKIKKLDAYQKDYFYDAAQASVKNFRPSDNLKAVLDAYQVVLKKNSSS